MPAWLSSLLPYLLQLLLQALQGLIPLTPVAGKAAVELPEDHKAMLVSLVDLSNRIAAVGQQVLGTTSKN